MFGCDLTILLTGVSGAMAQPQPMMAAPITADLTHPDSIRLAADPWGITLPVMQHLIIHACGHEQVHALTGPQGQQARKLRWLATTECHACFVAARHGATARTQACDLAAVEHLGLSELTGSVRQVAWATTIRASRLAAMLRSDVSDTTNLSGVTDAKWWIDHRDEADAAVLARAAALVHRQRQGEGDDPHDAMLCAA